jgi:hypothetical protein
LPPSWRWDVPRFKLHSLPGRLPERLSPVVCETSVRALVRST